MKIDLEQLILLEGGHKSADDGVCLMEAVALFAGEPHSDRPVCASSVLTKFGIQLNDRMYNEERQLLKPFIPRLIGTNDGHELTRSRILAWSAITEFAPMALRATKNDALEVFAARLEGLTVYDWKNARIIAIEATKAASLPVYADAYDAAYDAACAAAYIDAACAAAYIDANVAATYAADCAGVYATANADARKRIFDLAIAAFDRAIRLKEPS